MYKVIHVGYISHEGHAYSKIIKYAYIFGVIRTELDNIFWALSLDWLCL